jgi:hypothetical protein
VDLPFAVNLIDCCARSSRRQGSNPRGSPAYLCRIQSLPIRNQVLVKTHLLPLLILDRNPVEGLFSLRMILHQCLIT